jgi:Fe-S-cluster containining protein
MPEACRCGLCCEVFRVEATLADADREPRIAEQCTPLFAHVDVEGEAVQTEEVVAYVLNRGGLAGSPCVFLERDSFERGVCSIYETRPDVCRRFDCSGEGERQLVALGYLPGRTSSDRGG